MTVRPEHGRFSSPELVAMTPEKADCYNGLFTTNFWLPAQDVQRQGLSVGGRGAYARKTDNWTTQGPDHKQIGQYQRSVGIDSLYVEYAVQ